jgi:hypothetical protein
VCTSTSALRFFLEDSLPSPWSTALKILGITGFGILLGSALGAIGHDSLTKKDSKDVS